MPISGRAPLRDLLEFTNRHMLRGVMKSLGMRAPLIWFSRPSVANHVGQFGEKLVIYHVVDEYTAYDGMSEGARQRLQDQERRLLKQADLVIVVSDSLLRAKRPFNKQTYLVPNGVDYRAYTCALDSNQAPPADIAALPKPLIGYSGLIAARLDLVLLRDLAEAHPEWSLALMGAVDDRYCARESSRPAPHAECTFLRPKGHRSSPVLHQSIRCLPDPVSGGRMRSTCQPVKAL